MGIGADHTKTPDIVEATTDALRVRPVFPVFAAEGGAGKCCRAGSKGPGEKKGVGGGGVRKEIGGDWGGLWAKSEG